MRSGARAVWLRASPGRASRGAALESSRGERLGNANLVATQSSRPSGRFLAVLADGPTALVLEGETGIGTTVWRAAVEAAEALSFRVLQARPAESEARLSYSALADLVGEAFDEVGSMLPAPQRRALDAALLRAEVDGGGDPRATATAVVRIL